MPDPIVDPVVPPTEPWYKGADDTFVGELQRRGLQDKSPLEVAQNFMAAHREAEKLVGAPANELVRWPKDANDAANWATLRARLGVPTEAAGYDFSELKNADGTPVDPTFVERSRTLAATLQLPKDQAVALAKTLYENETKAAADAAATKAAAAAAEGNALKTAWGNNYEINRVAAVNAANTWFQKAGLKPEDAAAAVNAMEAAVGGAKAMEGFLALSRSIGEDNLGGGNGGGPPGVMSYQEAKATKEALLRDQAWVAKWNNGDAEAARQIAALDTILVNSQPASEEAEFRRQVAAQYRA